MSLRTTVKTFLYGRCPGFAGSFLYFGTRVYFPRRSSIFAAACQQGVYEADIVHLLTQFVRPHTTCFDVGGNIGLMAIPVLNACHDCRVVSFEPSPNSLPYLTRTIAESRYSNRWLINPYALWAEAGELEFCVGDPRDALYEGFKSSERIRQPRKAKVPVSTLDTEWERLGKPDVSLVKLDTEGAEGGILRGAHSLLRACHPHLVVEWHEKYLARFDTSTDLLLRLAQHFCYRIYSIPGGVPVDDKTTLRLQMTLCSNFILIPVV